MDQGRPGAAMDRANYLVSGNVRIDLMGSSRDDFPESKIVLEVCEKHTMKTLRFQSDAYAPSRVKEQTEMIGTLRTTGYPKVAFQIL